MPSLNMISLRTCLNITKGNQVLSKQVMPSLNMISLSDQKSVDTKGPLHARHMKILGKNSIMMRKCDSDQLVLAIAVLAFLQFYKFWLSFGVGRSHKYIPVHDLVHQLGHSVAKAIPGFHAFTVCDTVSSFHGKGKKTCWDIFQIYPEFFPAFSVLSEIIP